MIKKITNILLLIASASLFFGCKTSEDYKELLTFHIAQKNSMEGVSNTRTQMPRSGLEFIVTNTYFLSHADLEHVDVAEIFPEGMRVRGLLFTFNEAGAKKLFRETSGNKNSWIIVKEKYFPIGLRRIDQMINDGKLFMLMEFPEETDFHEKAASYNDGIRIIKERLKEKNSSMFRFW